MQVTSTDIPDVKLITPVRHGDARGFFRRTFRRRRPFSEHGITVEFVQDNQAYSKAAEVVRALHFQAPPFAQAKLVRVSAGAILDVAVDIRRGSPTYGKHVAVTLTAEAGNQLFVPEGFAHGYRTLVPDTEVIYKVNRYYDRQSEGGLRWDDPALGIDWGVSGDADTQVLERDRNHPLLADLVSPFSYAALGAGVRLMKLLVFGGRGQVGTELRRALLPPGMTLTALDRAALDIGDRAAIVAAIRRERPDLVVNAAAYTAVDKAESEMDAAFAINATAPGEIAAACAEAGIPLIHISTDYVYDGTNPGPYVETDPINPLGIYGRSKAAGDTAVAAALIEHVILRTAWVYGAHGGNFVKTMLRLASERPSLRVVADQHGSPTAAAEIAAAVIAIAAKIGAGEGRWGVFHFTGAGATTWHGFAEAIVALAGKTVPVAPITTAEYPTPARRPANSVLDCTKIAATYGVGLRPWRDALAEVIAELSAGGQTRPT